MIDIENTIISRDVISCFFVCNLSACKGACCIQGDSGAPLEKEEAEILEQVFPKLKPYLSRKGINAIAEQGTSTIDVEKDTVTPLIAGKECAYVIFEKGIARCGIEKAFHDGVISFRKPSSCHLYPVRIRKNRTFEAVNYDRWEICEPARENGRQLKMPLYRFVREALVNRYGRDWYRQLEVVARDNFREDN